MSNRVISHCRSVTGCLSNDAKNYKIMESFIRDNATLVHAKLHGFRFASEITGDEDDITISCAVKICTGHSGECNDVSIRNIEYRDRSRDREMFLSAFFIHASS